MKKDALDPEFKAAVKREIDAHWETVNRPLPLAALGQRLIRQNINLTTALRGRKMREILESEFADSYTVRNIEGKDLSFEILPKNSEAAVSDEVSPKKAKGANWLPSALWLAFTRPIATGRSRIISLRPFRFEDISAAEVAGTDLRIDPGHIVLRSDTEEPADWAARVQDKVGEWVAANGLSFEDARGERPPKVSVFDRLMAVLTKSQKERILIPLDIVEFLKGTE